MGASLKKISKSLKRSQSTVSREVMRNTGLRGYRYKQANRLALKRQQTKPKAIKLTDSVKRLIEHYIKLDWSPEQVAGRLKRDGIISLHHETIYQHILKDKEQGGTLHQHLRHSGKVYKKRHGSKKRSAIVDRVDIDERPEAANNRERVGDWEGDTIIGKGHKGAILTLDERKTKLRLAAPLKGKEAKPLALALIALLMPLKSLLLTLTLDNGGEFALHKMIAKALGINIYFAKPYHSWERGQNENANGLLRQYFPKKMALDNISTKEVMDAVDKLNSRPRKCLGFKTPYEAFKELTGVDARELMGYALMT